MVSEWFNACLTHVLSLLKRTPHPSPPTPLPVVTKSCCSYRAPHPTPKKHIHTRHNIPQHTIKSRTHAHTNSPSQAQIWKTGHVYTLREKPYTFLRTRPSQPPSQKQVPTVCHCLHINSLLHSTLSCESGSKSDWELAQGEKKPSTKHILASSNPRGCLGGEGGGGEVREGRVFAQPCWRVR